ncbi:MAG: magnesium transporter CorA family protein [Bacillales bacterium]|nr:magnesium transporter CorA family protein [Bacillales bacterium]
MLSIYNLDEKNKILKTDEYVKGCWINLIAPTPKEINQIAEKLDIDIDFLKDALDDEERSRVEKEDGHVFILVDFPYLTADDSGFAMYETMPIGIVITDQCIVTISLMECPFLTDFINNKMKGAEPFKKTRFALQILFSISNYYLRYLKQINRRTNEVEKELHKTMRNKELYTLMAIEKSLVYFTTSLKSNKTVLQKLLRMNFLKMYEEDKDLLEDVIIDNTQAIEMVETYSSILSHTMDAFSSVISNNLNIVMKFLASVTIIMTIPTIVASFFGMNYPLPFGGEKNPWGFLIAMGIAFVLSAAAATVFWKKNFFKD